MSLFRLLADRGGFAPPGAAAPVMVPKGRGVARAEVAPEEDEMQTARPLRGAAEPPLEEDEANPARIGRVVADEEEAQPSRLLRRTEQEGEEEMQTARLAGRPEEPEEELQASLMARQPIEDEEETAQPARLRRQDDEEEGEAAQPARVARAPEPENEEEEPIQPARLRRQGTEEGEDEEAQPRRLRREARPDAPELDPETAPPPDVPLDVPEPNDLRARRETVSPPPAAGHVRSGPDPAASPAGSLAPGFSAYRPPTPAPAAPRSAPPGGDRFERPNIVIDQIDVLIHEPAAPPARAASPSRSLRARYLRRL